MVSPAGPPRGGEEAPGRWGGRGAARGAPVAAGAQRVLLAFQVRVPRDHGAGAAPRGQRLRQPRRPLPGVQAGDAGRRRRGEER